MPPFSPAPGTPQDWMARARGKLAMAKQPLADGAMWEDQCFWAQQAAELAIKDVYQQRGSLFPFIHDLAQLLNGLEQQGVTIPPKVRECAKLTVFATVARYPGLTAPATQSHHEEAVRIAEAVLAWAGAIIP